MTDIASLSTSALYLDLELSCWDVTPPLGLRNEIIELGVVEMDLTTCVILGEAQHFVRPVGLWDISDYCTKITGITRPDIIGADSLEDVLKKLQHRFEFKDKRTVAWGHDVTVIKQACSSAKIDCPFRHPLDLSTLCRDLFFLSGHPSLEAALERMGMEFDGVQHGALADARNAARVHAGILQVIRQSPLESLPLESKPIEPQLSPFATKLALAMREARTDET
jgi:inhibitor of KinA sporulation pathway (predicted exonuclease)